MPEWVLTDEQQPDLGEKVWVACYGIYRGYRTEDGWYNEDGTPLDAVPMWWWPVTDNSSKWTDNKMLRPCPECNSSDSYRTSGCEVCNRGWQELGVVYAKTRRVYDLQRIGGFVSHVETTYPEEEMWGWKPCPDYLLPWDYEREYVDGPGLNEEA